MDETEHCELCGCGMLDAAAGWQCPECGHVVECVTAAAPRAETPDPKT